MKKLIALVPVLLAAPVLAQTMPEDTDGNGTWSLTEIAAAHPQVSEDRFAEIDTNGDGQVDADEYATAKAAGMLDK